jgi:hypothetical protein
MKQGYSDFELPMLDYQVNKLIGAPKVSLQLFHTITIMLYANNKALIPHTNHMDFISTLYIFNVFDMSKIGYL